MSDHHEIERTWAPPPGAEVPDLTELPKVVAVSPPRTSMLEATYLDTADLALARAGVSLRRRTGGNDAGWHVKIPAGHGRDEIHRPLGRATSTPPPALVRVLQGWTRGAALVPVATLSTQRAEHDLLDSDGEVLAVLADDRVEGHVVIASDDAGKDAGKDAGESAVGSAVWREWELELTGGTRTLFAAADQLFARADVLPAEVSRKIEVVLAGRLPEPVEFTTPKPGKAASRVLHRYLADQVHELALQDSQVRRGSGGGVHKMRIATRRLRSALATYRPLLEREITDPIREDLGWVARGLSELRDSQVVHERLRLLLDEEPRAAVVGPVRRRLGATYRARERDALREALSVLTSPRYFRVLEALDRLVADPPWTARAEDRADRVLGRCVLRDWDKLRAAHEAVEGAVDREEAWHEVRKAGKRLRYAAEVIVPVAGKDAERVGKAATRLTSVLGEVQDTVVSRAQLLELSRLAGAAGENAFTYGRLHAVEEARAIDAAGQLEDAWSGLETLRRRSKKRLGNA